MDDMTMKAQKTERNSLLAQIHIAIKKKGVSDEWYRDWLEEFFFVRSSTELDTDELRTVVKILRKVGWFDGRGRGANGDEMRDRPTYKQWNMLAALSRQMGWDGLEDKALATFVLRIAKVHSPRFLNKKQMSKVLTGMEKWRKNLDKKSSTIKPKGDNL